MANNTVMFTAGTLERRVYDYVRSKYHHLLSENLIRELVSDILQLKVVHLSEGEKIADLNEKLQEVEDNEEALIEAMKSFKDELKVIHQELNKKIVDLDSTIRDVESLATSTERKIHELEHIPTKKGANNGQSVLQEA